ncbi:hypothetical protein C0J52_03834 [Blattella germanica]|nr:hypothetical protein C0J52_03834 [Blattella germanica]
MTLEVMKFLTSRNIPTAVLLSSSRLMPVQANFCNPLRVLLCFFHHVIAFSQMFENYKLKGVIWLAFLEADQTVEQLLGNTYMRYDILFLVAKYDGTDVHIYEVYHVKHGGPLYIQKFGVYRDKLITTVFDSMYMRRQSLGGHIIKTVGINEKGAMGFLVRHEAEAGVCGLAMTGVRAEVVSFTIPIAIFHLHGIEETTIEIPIREAIFNVLGAICQQGQASTPLSANCRFVFIMSYILSLVLVCAYSATVISFLTVKDVNLPFSNLEELYMDDDFRLGVLNASAKFMKFQNAKTGILKDVYTKKLKPEELQLPNTVHEGLIKICSTKKYSFLTPLEKATVFFNKVPCHIFTIPYDISVLPMSIAFVKNSSFIGLFQYK